MSALTAARDAKRQDGKLLSYKLGAAKTVYKGGLVAVLQSTGYAQAAGDTSGTVVVGVAHETVDNSAGSAGDKSVRVEKTGVYQFSKTGAVITDVSKLVYVSDDQTVSVSATTNSIPCGYVASLVDSSHVAVRIDRSVQ